MPSLDLSCSLEECISGETQIASRHFSGLLETEQPQNRGAHVAQRTAVAQTTRAVAVHDKEWYRIGRVRGVRSASLRIDHHLTVAVIRGDEQACARGLRRRNDARETAIYSFHRFQDGGDRARMTDHVGVGVVAEDEIVLARRDGRSYGLDPRHLESGGNCRSLSCARRCGG